MSDLSFFDLDSSPNSPVVPLQCPISGVESTGSHGSAERPRRPPRIQHMPSEPSDEENDVTDNTPKRPRLSGSSGRRGDRTVLISGIECTSSHQRSRHPPMIESSDEENEVTDNTPKRPRLSGSSGGEGSGLLEMREMLSNVCEKVEENQRALKELQSKQQQENDSTPSRAKKCKVPNDVRKEVRKVYKDLEVKDQNFKGWLFGEGKSIKSDENHAVVMRLVKEVKGLNSSFNASDIREAAYRYYRTKSEENSAEKRGRLGAKKLVKRRHERKVRKRKERTSALMQNSKLTEAARQKWLNVMTNDMMSSEESGEEGTLVIHRPRWRSEYVLSMFGKIDDYCRARKSPQARRQMKNRSVVGVESSRPAPVGAPTWALKEL